MSSSRIVWQEILIEGDKMWEVLQQFYVAAQGRKKAQTIQVCDNLSLSLLTQFEILASDMFLQFPDMFHY